MGNACEACEHPSVGREDLRLEEDKAATPVDDKVSKP